MTAKDLGKNYFCVIAIPGSYIRVFNVAHNVSFPYHCTHIATNTDLPLLLSDSVDDMSKISINRCQSVMRISKSDC